MFDQRGLAVRCANGDLLADGAGALVNAAAIERTTYAARSEAPTAEVTADLFDQLRTVARIRLTGIPFEDGAGALVQAATVCGLGIIGWG